MGETWLKFTTESTNTGDRNGSERNAKDTRLRPEKGTPNKRTVLDREEAKEAAKRIAAAAGIELKDIDAHTLLQLFHRCEDFSPRFRKECAAEALKYEKPALSSMDSRVDSQVSYVVELPPVCKDMDEWRRLHDPSHPLYGGDTQQSSNDQEWESKLKRIAANARAKKRLDS
jgi:hypothetical protein